MDKVGCEWNVMGVDLKNEPHGAATWGHGKPTDWNKFAEKAIRRIANYKKCFKGLFFVEGIDNKASSPTQDTMPWAHWGEMLTGAYWHPINVGGGLDHRVVYSPHTYGPSHYCAHSLLPRS